MVPEIDLPGGQRFADSREPVAWARLFFYRAARFAPSTESEIIGGVPYLLGENECLASYGRVARECGLELKVARTAVEQLEKERFIVRIDHVKRAQVGAQGTAERRAWGRAQVKAQVGCVFRVIDKAFCALRDKSKGIGEGIGKGIGEGIGEGTGEGILINTQPTQSAQSVQNAFFFLTKSGENWTLPEVKRAEYIRRFPDLDVDVELHKAAGWLLDNPEKRKTAKGMTAFLGRWLQSNEDRRAEAAKNDWDTIKDDPEALRRYVQG